MLTFILIVVESDNWRNSSIEWQKSDVVVEKNKDQEELILDINNAAKQLNLNQLRKRMQKSKNPITVCNCINFQWFQAFIYGGLSQKASFLFTSCFFCLFKPHIHHFNPSCFIYTDGLCWAMANPHSFKTVMLSVWFLSRRWKFFHSIICIQA